MILPQVVRLPNLDFPAMIKRDFEESVVTTSTATPTLSATVKNMINKMVQEFSIDESWKRSYEEALGSCSSHPMTAP